MIINENLFPDKLLVFLLALFFKFQVIVRAHVYLYPIMLIKWVTIQIFIVRGFFGATIPYSS